ncbi:hypothetical protein CAC42_334 [Sphaceloma murrayae]|uniref:Uncharacterized protein n=1 Tax=Sphaceloma murrayae TaxID=2082308 RepID=A0A2K1QZY2_9PEZI|nr:hypothetical protein CAC42_334 [Sphaceloma murrayae]
MDDQDRIEVNSLRFSSTPRGSPKIVNALTSPVQSIRPEMDLQHDHQGHGMPSYLEDASSDEDEQHRSIMSSNFRKSRSTTVRNPEAEKFAAFVSGVTKPDQTENSGTTAHANDTQRQSPDPSGIAQAINGMRLTHFGEPVRATHGNDGGQSARVPPKEDMLSFRHLIGAGPLDGHSNNGSLHSSFDGSITELQGLGALSHNNSRLRHKGNLPHPFAESGGEDDQVPMLGSQAPSDDILRLHAMSLEALRQREDVRKTMTPPPLLPARASLPLKASIPGSLVDAASASSTKAVRKVSLHPPAIDVSRARDLKQKPIPSPYPVYRNRNGRDQLASPRSDISLTYPRDTILHVHIKSRQQVLRTTGVALPPSCIPPFSAIKTGPTKEKERHFRALDYDDAVFANALRSAYAELVPWHYRWFAARSLCRITVSGHMSRLADKSYGWLDDSKTVTRQSGRRIISASGFEVSTIPVFHPRDPSHGKDADEAKLMDLFCHPKSARGRYAWVSWARRIAETNDMNGSAAPDTTARPTNNRDSTERFMELTNELDRRYKQVQELLYSQIESFRAGTAGEAPVRPGTAGQWPASPGSRISSANMHHRSASARFSSMGDEMGRSMPVTPVTPVAGLTVSTGRRMEDDEFEGLMFVLKWDVKRIVGVLVLVVLGAVAAALLWVFLGTGRGAIFARPMGEGMTYSDAAGYRGAGDRVGPGAVLGICVMLVGLTGIGGWIGVSWLVI